MANGYVPMRIVEPPPELERLVGVAGDDDQAVVPTS